MTVLYIDVSHHDRSRRGGPLDWAAIKAATSPVMFARATYGDPAGFNPSSPYFGEFMAGAKAAGFIVRTGYHNLINGDQSSINRQVDYFRRTLDAQGADAAMADIEPYPELVKNGLWPRWDAVRRFHDRWYSVEDRVCAWYIAQWFWTVHPGPDLGAPDLRVLRGPLVQSHYAGGDGTAAQIYAAAGGDKGTGWDDKYGNRLPDIWQFTSSANVPGASGSTDVNAFRGTLDQLRALLTNQPQGDDMDAEQSRQLYNLDRLHTALLAGQTTVTGLRLQDGTTASMPLPIAAQAKAAADAANQAVALVKTLAATPPGTVTITDEQLERVLIKVLGSVDGATPPA